MATKPANANPSTGAQSIKRAASLLKLVAAGNENGSRLIDLHTAAGLERPTAHRLLRGLMDATLVRQDSATRRYFLGRGVHELGGAMGPRSVLLDICHPYLVSIADRTDDTVFLTLRSGLDGVCIDRVEGSFPVKVFVMEVGKRRPLNIGAGAIAILSALGVDEVENILRANSRHVARKYPRYDSTTIRARIDVARRSGYVLNDIIEVPGVRAVGVPICNSAGQPIGAISVSALANRLDDSRILEVATLLKDVAGIITASRGI